MTEKIGRTLEELYDTYIGDFSKFLQLTGGYIRTEDDNGQLGVLFINDFDELSNYLDCTVLYVSQLNDDLNIIIRNNYDI